MSESIVIVVGGYDGPAGRAEGRALTVSPVATRAQAKAPQRETLDEQRQREAAAKRARKAARQARGMR